MDKINTDKTDRIAIGLFAVLLAMQLSMYKMLYKLVPMFSYEYNTAAICVIYTMLVGVIFALVVFPRAKSGLVGKYKNLVVELVILLLAIILTDVVTMVKGQLRITNILTHNIDIFMLF